MNNEKMWIAILAIVILTSSMVIVILQQSQQQSAVATPKCDLKNVHLGRVILNAGLSANTSINVYSQIRNDYKVSLTPYMVYADFLKDRTSFVNGTCVQPQDQRIISMKMVSPVDLASDVQITFARVE